MARDNRHPHAGVLLLFSDGPHLVETMFDEEGKVRIGREDPIGSSLTDERLSRHHAEIVRSKEGVYVVRDLGSRNGTAVDGHVLERAIEVRGGAIVRAGGTIFVVRDDVTLREQLDEIPNLVHRELAIRGRSAHHKLIETCLLRPWPGNVAELLSEIGVASDAANAEGVDVVRADHLRPAAGMPAKGD